MKARAEADVVAILEGDSQLMGEEARAANLLKGGW